MNDNIKTLSDTMNALGEVMKSLLRENRIMNRKEIREVDIAIHSIKKAIKIISDKVQDK